MPETTILTPELEEQLKQQAKAVEGLELEKIVAPRSYDHLVQDTLVFVPFAKDSDFSPAAPYKDAVKGIAKPGIADKYLLLASYVKLAEQYKSRAVLDFSRYTHAGVPEALEAHKEDLAKLEQLAAQAPKGSPAQKAAYERLDVAVNAIAQPVIRDNVGKNEQRIEELLRNADAAYAGSTKTLGIVTPPYVLDVDENNRHLVADKQQAFQQMQQEIGKYVDAFGSNLDKKNYATGNRVYVTHFKTVKQKGKDGKNADAKVIDRIEVYRKKAA
jgi:hypothetical protein